MTVNDVNVLLQNLRKEIKLEFNKDKNFNFIKFVNRKAVVISNKFEIKENQAVFLCMIAINDVIKEELKIN